MGRPCKVCSCSFRQDIDKEILNGQSFDWLEKFCRDRGFTISHTSLKRHALNHVPEYQPRSQTGYNYTPTEIPRNETMAEAITQPTIIQPVKVTNKNLVDVAKKQLIQILTNQLAIVEAKQKNFMLGSGKYPSDEIRGLKNIMDCFEIITGKEKHKRSSQHIFDLEAALQASEDTLPDIDNVFNDFDKK